MKEIRATEIYRRWFAGLQDRQAKRRIRSRVSRLQMGHRGDIRFVGSGVWELRIHSGPGYRIYFTERDGAVVILLAGGDKGSQARDIRRAIALAEEL